MFKKLFVLFLVGCFISLPNLISAEITREQEESNPQLYRLTSLYYQHGILLASMITKHNISDNAQQEPFYNIFLVLGNEEGIDFYSAFNENDNVDFEFKSARENNTLKLPLTIAQKKKGEEGVTLLGFAANDELTNIIANSSGVDFNFRSPKLRLSLSLDDNAFSEWKQIVSVKQPNANSATKQYSGSIEKDIIGHWVSEDTFKKGVRRTDTGNNVVTTERLASPIHFYFADNGIVTIVGKGQTIRVGYTIESDERTDGGKPFVKLKLSAGEHIVALNPGGKSFNLFQSTNEGVFWELMNTLFNYVDNRTNP